MRRHILWLGAALLLVLAMEGTASAGPPNHSSGGSETHKGLVALQLARLRGWEAGNVSFGVGDTRARGSERVRAIQRALRAVGYSPGRVDGNFGPQTEAAVRRYQQARGLARDGIVGARTLGHLRTDAPRHARVSTVPAAEQGQDVTTDGTSKPRKTRSRNAPGADSGDARPAAPPTVQREAPGGAAVGREARRDSSQPADPATVVILGVAAILVVLLLGVFLRHRGGTRAASAATSGHRIDAGAPSFDVRPSRRRAAASSVPEIDLASQPQPGPNGTPAPSPRLSAPPNGRGADSRAIPLPSGLVWVVLPTYNEVENVKSVLGTLLTTFDNWGIEGHVLVVDDGSPDGTAERAMEVARADRRVEVLERTGKQGLGSAYRAGFDRALAREADYVVEMDCDLSHDPGQLPDLLAAAHSADLVIGSRYVSGGSVTGWSRMRWAISRWGCCYARALLGVEIRDLTGGFKCFRRVVLETLPLDEVAATGYGFQIELTYRALKAGFRVAEVPIVFAERVRGQSKMTGGIILEAALLVPRLRHAFAVNAKHVRREPSVNGAVSTDQEGHPASPMGLGGLAPTRPARTPAGIVRRVWSKRVESTRPSHTVVPITDDLYIEGRSLRPDIGPFAGPAQALRIPLASGADPEVRYLVIDSARAVPLWVSLDEITAISRPGTAPNRSRTVLPVQAREAPDGSTTLRHGASGRGHARSGGGEWRRSGRSAPARHDDTRGEQQ